MCQLIKKIHSCLFKRKQKIFSMESTVNDKKATEKVISNIDSISTQNHITQYEKYIYIKHYEKCTYQLNIQHTK